MNLRKLLDKLEIEIEESTIRAIACEYFMSDLHFIPFKEIYEKTSEELVRAVKTAVTSLSFSRVSNRRINRNDALIDESEYRYVKFLFSFLYSEDERWIYEEYPSALIGAYSFTRSITYLDASRVFDRWFNEEWDSFISILEIYNQIPLTKDEVPIFIFDGNEKELTLYKKLVSNKVDNLDVALTSYKVEGESWSAKVRGMQEPDSTRLPRLYALVNSILNRKSKHVDIIVLPELAISDFSLRLISEQLRNSNIALVTGLDYEINRDLRTARNRLAYVVPIEKNGRVIHLQIVQDKAIPAIHEGNELWDIGKLKLESLHKSKFLVKHRGAIISSLICNEFLNIDYRQKLRGEIDALILLEWNQDINSYNSLVESSANDLHCFMVQVNNRLYGDTRVRAPFKKDYKRDVARVRGGEDDYYVIAHLDIKALRLFQMNHVSPTDDKASFKPVPAGYDMKVTRRLK